MCIEGAVVRRPVPVADLEGAHHTGVLWRAAPGRLLLDVPGVARYLVRDGIGVDIDPCPGAGDAEVRRFLRMTPAAALYFQRGILVLHAAVAVSSAGQAVVLAGESGSGKSVLLDALVRRGWGLLAGNLAPVRLDGDHAPIAVPTWPQAMARPGQAAPASAGQDSHWDGAFVDEPRRIRAVWWLGIHNADTVDVQNVRGLTRFDAVGAMVYQRLIASALLDRASYLRTAGALAGADILFGRLIRPRGRWSADELADIVESATTTGGPIRHASHLRTSAETAPP